MLNHPAPPACLGISRSKTRFRYRYTGPERLDVGEVEHAGRVRIVVKPYGLGFQPISRAVSRSARVPVARNGGFQNHAAERALLCRRFEGSPRCMVRCVRTKAPPVGPATGHKPSPSSLPLSPRQQAKPAETSPSGVSTRRCWLTLLTLLARPCWRSRDKSGS
ncbi:hypothetical protein VTI74DRAFT_7950 [Chaetomium olivicolor]